MDKRIYGLLFSCVMVVLTAHAVEGGDDCGAKLVAGDPYYSVIYARAKAGLLSPEQLAAIAEADQPTNPLATETPRSQNASAIRLFEALVKDPTVKAEWFKTRELIRDFLAQFSGTEYLRKDAAENTKHILAPTLDSRIDDSTYGYAFTNLPDGRAVVAHFVLREMLVTDVVTKKPIGRVPLPRDADLSDLKAVWHLDKAGQQWIYISSNHLSGLHVYRVKFGDSEFTSIKHPLALPRQEHILKEMRSVMPGLILATAERKDRSMLADLFNLESGKYEQVYESADSDFLKDLPVGLSIQPSSDSRFLFRTAGGKSLVATPSGKNAIEVVTNGLRGEAVTFPLASGQSAWHARLSFYEDKEHIYLAVVSNSRVQIFEPFAGTAPLVDIPGETVLWAPTHWFRSPTGDLHFAVCSKDSPFNLTIIDVVARLVQQFRYNLPVRGFVSVGDQTYFAIGGGDKFDLHRMFNEPHRP